jgi:thymidine kinase
MNSMKKAQELKAQNVATDIFNFHMESDRFKNLDNTEKLELLSEKVDTLKTKFKQKPFALIVAKRLLWMMEDYSKENDLCPDCFQETSYQVISRQTYWQPEEGKLCCEYCGWGEAM